MSTFKMADEFKGNVQKLNDEKVIKESSKPTGKKRKLSKEEKKSLKEKKAKVSVRKRPGFDKELYDETSYFVRNGLRHVVPYYFTFTSYCKGRWVGRKILDVFKQEFRSEPPEYYERAIKSGKITVNGELATSDSILKDNDVICHKVHRHEPPVTADTIQLVVSNQDVVVINKPSSIPVHPCGRYRHNTIVFLLGKEYGLTNLFTVHRIDRLTSGILMFAKTLKKAQELEEQVRERRIEKEYVCRVKGDFPSEPLECDEPILVVSHKVGVCRVSPDGKPCKTVFTKLHGDGATSVVKCNPHTGRMHQIRVHLQWLGYPIIDDPIYNSPVWGEKRGKGGVTDDEALKVIKSLAESSPTIIDTENGESSLSKNSTPSQLNGGTSLNDETQSYSNVKDQDCSKLSTIREQDCTKLSIVNHEEDLLPSSNKKDEKLLLSSNLKNEDISASSIIGDEDLLPSPTIKDLDCSECNLKRRDPTTAELTMCLHALSYKGPDWDYSTEMPSWAAKDCEKK